MKLFSAIIPVLFLMQACAGQEYHYKNYSFDLADLIDSLNVSTDSISIWIDKSDYVLAVKAGRTVVKEYPVVFGGNPLDDKLRQGDSCTPEGDFRIVSKYPHRSWSKFIWINYPTNDSWRRHNRAKREGLIPEEAGIGGEIGIHGVPKGMDFLIDRKSNWTLGCISLKNSDVNEIYPYFSDSTLIRISK